MQRRVLGRAAIAGTFLVALVACSSGDPGPPAGAGATVPTAPATTTTTDPYAVPAVIDAAYVNRVLAGLDAGVGDVVRMVVQAKTIPREGVDRLRAFYGTDDALNRILDSLSLSIARGLTGFRPQPGNKKSTVTELVLADKACIFAKVSRDFTAVSLGSVPTDDVQWVVLKPLNSSRDAGSFNTVGWAYVYEGYEPNRTPPVNPCA